MASTSGSRSGKKNTSSSSRTRSSSNTNRQKGRTTGGRGSAAGRRTGKESLIANEIVLIGVFALCVLFFLCNFGIIGPVGNAVSAAMFGIFGMTAYVVPVLIFVGLAFGISNQGSTLAYVKIGAGAVLILLAGVILELVGGQVPSMEKYSIVSLYQVSAENKTGGGVLSGSLAYLLNHFLGMVGAVLLVIVLAIICLVLITERSFVGGVKKGSRRVYESAREDARIRKERAVQRREEQEERREEERRRREAEKRLEAEKVLRMDKKVSGVMMNPVLEQEEGYAAADIPVHTMYQEPERPQEIPYENAGRRLQELAGAAPDGRAQQEAEQAAPLQEQGAVWGSTVKKEEKPPVRPAFLKGGREEDGRGSRMGQIRDFFRDNKEVRKEADGAQEAQERRSEEETEALKAAFSRRSTSRDPLARTYGNSDVYRDMRAVTPVHITVKPLPDPSGRSLPEAMPGGAGMRPIWDGAAVTASEDAAWPAQEEAPADVKPSENASNSGVTGTAETAADASAEAGEGREESIVSEHILSRPDGAGWGSREEDGTSAELPWEEGRGDGAQADSAMPSGGLLEGTAEEERLTDTAKEHLLDQEAPPETEGEAYRNRDQISEEACEDDEEEQGGTAFSAAGSLQASAVSPAGGRPQAAASAPAGSKPQASAVSSVGLRPQAACPPSSAKAQASLAPARPKPAPRPYHLPPLSLLKQVDHGDGRDAARELRNTAAKLQQTLATFGVKVTITNISQGPAVTRYELQPEQGVKVSKIVGLTDDIKLNLAATDIRIEAPIPGKAAVGIEVPNKENTMVGLRELLESREFKEFPSRLAFAVGKDIAGKTVVSDIARMPHMLIAGSTGSGKSVCINTLIMSILYKARPDEVKLILVDPKVVELSVYNGIPHLLIPVVTDPKQASGALRWGVAEMTDRYQKFADMNVRDLKGYNKKLEEMRQKGVEDVPDKLPQIVIIVDELADLMMVAPGEVEESICRLAQLARAAGIHLIIATQRPSVDVITGLIKANMPSRVAFAVSSGVDSRTILDMNGAEKLLGKGDMLFYPQGYPKPARVQGAFVSDGEVSDVVDFLKNQVIGNVYDDQILEKVKSSGSGGGFGGESGDDGSQRDSYFEQAGRFIIEKDKASIGMLQRAFKIGFNRAARIMDQLADAGVVGEEEGTKPRKILMSEEQFEQYIEEYL